MTDEQSALEAAEDGLFRVVQALGFDTDGAQNARELFGPMTYCREEGRFTTAPDIAVAYAKDYREEMEEEASRSDYIIQSLIEWAEAVQKSEPSTEYETGYRNAANVALAVARAATASARGGNA
ncbi:hypothetical protein [Microbacterium sp. KNMS]